MKACCWLSNRSALAVICWVINHCLEVSCKVDQIMSVECKWFIYLKLTDKLWFITQQITHKSWSISILTHRKWQKSNCILLILLTFCRCIDCFDCNTVVYMHFLYCWRKKDDITPSNILETKTDVSKVSKWRWNGARKRHALPLSDLLHNKSLNLTIGYISEGC